MEATAEGATKARGGDARACTPCDEYGAMKSEVSGDKAVAFLWMEVRCVCVERGSSDEVLKAAEASARLVEEEGATLCAECSASDSGLKEQCARTGEEGLDGRCVDHAGGVSLPSATARRCAKEDERKMAAGDLAGNGAC